MSFRYSLPDPIPWCELAGPAAAAGDAIARLDERLSRSPIRDGWIARTHFSDACAALWLDGGLVHLEDLVLHDAAMDVRAPSHELTRAHAILQIRRRVAEAAPGWALTSSGIDSLRGRVGASSDPDQQTGVQPVQSSAGRIEPDAPADDLAGLLAIVDAAIASAEKTLAGERRAPQTRDPLIYDPDWDEDARLAAWRKAVDETRDLPPVLAAAIAADAWDVIGPLQTMRWLGLLLAAAVLRARGQTRHHLACLQTGLRVVRQARRRPRERNGIAVILDSIAAAAEAGMKDHDRWLTAHTLLLRKLDGRRSTSHLPALIDYVMKMPMVSAAMIAAELKVTPRAAQSLIVELGLREVTGRGRYRAWGVL